MSAYLDSTVKEIDERLTELRNEISRLQAAHLALTSDGQRGGGARRRAATRKASSGPPVSASRTTAKPANARGTRRRRRAGERASKTLQLVRARPGITIPELARAMKIESNYLYRVLPKLAADGQIKRQGRGWLPVS